ncbi:ribokinase [uncultured Roseobacter sp.]|uniref:ribokinase n=1 Tax=uncultured Roseobacter sp. TaxID=114847 RepID=UPI00261DCA73|nr:ribokinase [uncultured Roseobacter sp.]
MTDVVVVGSINVDMTSYLARWPGVGETVTAIDTRIGLGGKGANQAIAAVRLDSSVALIGAIGSDSFGQDALNRLRRANVHLIPAPAQTEATGMAFIDVGPGGGNIIRLAEGANQTLSPEHIDTNAKTIAKAKILLLQNEVPIETSLRAAEIARAHDVRVIMDPAPAPVPFWSKDVLQAFDVITPNAHEAHLIFGALPQTLCEAQRAAEELRDFGPRGAIVTMGGLGVGWSIGTSRGSMAAPTVPTVDTVAAGDCFNGALATFLAQGAETCDAIQRAVYAAALATTRHGAAEATPTANELHEFGTTLGSNPLESGRV